MSGINAKNLLLEQKCWNCCYLDDQELECIHLKHDSQIPHEHTCLFWTSRDIMNKQLTEKQEEKILKMTEEFNRKWDRQRPLNQECKEIFNIIVDIAQYE